VNYLSVKLNFGVTTLLPKKENATQIQQFKKFMKLATYRVSGLDHMLKIYLLHRIKDKIILFCQVYMACTYSRNKLTYSLANKI
jgi:hypothetical protein